MGTVVSAGQVEAELYSGWKGGRQFRLSDMVAIDDGPGAVLDVFSKDRLKAV